MKESRLPELCIGVVDDEVMTLRVLEGILLSAGAGRVLTAPTWKAMEGQLSAVTPDVLLLDNFMPGISGMEALLVCRERYPSMLVIMVTAADDVHTAVTCMKRGAIDYLLKPLNSSEVIDAVNSIVMTVQVYSMGFRLPPHPAHSLQEARGNLAPFDPETLSSRKFLQTVHPPVEKEEKALLNRFLRYVTEHDTYSRHNLTIDQIAKELGTNRTYLSRVVNRIFGVSFPQLIGRIRVAAALKLIDSGHLGDFTVAAIAKEVGFSTEATFYRTFRSLIGRSPASLARDRERER